MIAKVKRARLGFSFQIKGQLLGVWYLQLTHPTTDARLAGRPLGGIMWALQELRPGVYEVHSSLLIPGQEESSEDTLPQDPDAWEAEGRPAVTREVAIAHLRRSITDLVKKANGSHEPLDETLRGPESLEEFLTKLESKAWAKVIGLARTDPTILH